MQLSSFNYVKILRFLCLISVFQIAGCARHQPRPSITAVGLSPANRCEPAGIPYYLPKPLLVVAKNVRHIDESKVGLTGPAPIPGGFDNQAAYADIKANVTVPPSSGSQGAATDGLQAVNAGDAGISTATLGTELSKSVVAENMTPAAADRFNGGVELDSFFTYQVIFVPDLTQKYGLRINGGAGEIRAAMNMVNGWMYTGMGPYYMKDSSSAQNAMATGVGAMFAGRGVADVVNSVGSLASTLTTAAKKEAALTAEQAVQLNNQMMTLEALATSTPKVPKEMLNYAEIYIYEPMLMGDQTEWRLVAEHHFNRHYFDTAADDAAVQAKQAILQSMLQGIVNAPKTEAATTDRKSSSSGQSTGQANGSANENAMTENDGSANSDAAVDMLKQNGANSQPAPNSGTSTSPRKFVPNSVNGRAQPQLQPQLPQVEINVLPESNNLPQSSKRPHNSSRFQSLFHREPAKIEQTSGNIDVSHAIRN